MNRNQLTTKRLFNFFDTSFLIILIITIVSGLAVYFTKGREIFLVSLEEDAKLFIKILPIITGGILLVGSMHLLLPSKHIAKWLGKDSGIKGIIMASVLGGITPGGPMVSFPLLITLKSKGADIGSLVSYITAWTTISFTRTLAWELPLMGVEFTLVRLTSSLILPLIAGLLFRKMFSEKRL